MWLSAVQRKSEQLGRWAGPGSARWPGSTGRVGPAKDTPAVKHSTGVPGTVPRGTAYTIKHTSTAKVNLFLISKGRVSQTSCALGRSGTVPPRRAGRAGTAPKESLSPGHWPLRL